MDDFTDVTSFSTILDSMAATSQESSDAPPFLGPDGIPVDMEIHKDPQEMIYIPPSSRLPTLFSTPVSFSLLTPADTHA
ncbi:hypothetical protein NUW54_g6155 [Trametes sanguinea]|uniref:Uncharacterized protein n=1 Tax=Trametes sanguinea TaxID=158606 RepID=A0ACC1PU32_9APHY|nr:hypothetical protein NUW54_g6155 [Trametes sanguinea]